MERNRGKKISIIDSVITIKSSSDITSTAASGYRATTIGSKIGELAQDSSFVSLLEDAEFGIMYEVKGSGGNTGRLYAKIKK